MEGHVFEVDSVQGLGPNGPTARGPRRDKQRASLRGPGVAEEEGEGVGCKEGGWSRQGESEKLEDEQPWARKGELFSG